MTKSESIQKLKLYCNYRERCHSEVRSKLLSLGVYGDDLEEVIYELIQDDNLNEERYARSYARGKHRINKWGKTRITRELKIKRVSEYCIKKGLSEINDDDYMATLDTIVDTYFTRRIGKYNTQALKRKTLQHAINKGYEYSSIMESISRITHR